nr:NADH dehydrogenase subunit 6 [Microcosmus sp. z YZ-2024]
MFVQFNLFIFFVVLFMILFFMYLFIKDYVIILMSLLAMSFLLFFIFIMKGEVFFSLIFLLVYSGGILLLFMYVVSMAGLYFEKLSFDVKNFFFFFLFLLTPMWFPVLSSSYSLTFFFNYSMLLVFLGFLMGVVIVSMLFFLLSNFMS